jgi:hypothetical protein
MAVAPLLLTAAPAAAAPPQFVEPAPTMTLPICGATEGILIEQVGRSQREHKNGRNTGSLRIRLTNVATGASVLVNASGPGSSPLTENPDGTSTFNFAATGQNLIFSYDATDEAMLAAQGLPGVFVSSGPIELNGTFNTETEASISLTVTRKPPRIRDLCAELT